MSARMFLMCGHPGSGKSTYAKEFAEKNGLRYISIDDTYEYFNGNFYDHSNKFEIWMIFYQAIHYAELSGTDIVVDTNAPTFIDRAEFLNWFPSFEHHLIWVHASNETCLENNNYRSRVIPIDQMQKIFNLFEAPTNDPKTKQRAQWQSISRVRNENNNFTLRETLSGVFPADVHDDIY